jgi:hypothetical protein
MGGRKIGLGRVNVAQFLHGCPVHTNIHILSFAEYSSFPAVTCLSHRI